MNKEAAWQLRQGHSPCIARRHCLFTCGADWIDDSTAAKLEEIVNDARKKHHIVEVTTLSA